MTLTVLDLFCGGGGIAEGFRQAGFHVVAALDKDRAAVETIGKNHPEAATIHADILDVTLTELPRCDVIVGGPPCIEFSSSKRGGYGNILAGLVLVQAFLRAVHLLRPRWWIMENVPRITKFLPDEVPLDSIGVEEAGSLHVEQRAVFNTADFGVPQARQRFLMGRFPLPDPTHSSISSDPLFRPLDHREAHRTLGEVVASLPNPVGPRPRPGLVEDFNYGFSIPIEELTDHFVDCILSETEVRRIRKAKVLHPFYGFLPFPDQLDRPARTVVATQMGRETLVIGTAIDDAPAYRRATVRECAVLQTFPLTYQFWGTTLSTRYRLVGDAVPPRLAYLIACKIRAAEGLAVPASPHVDVRVRERAPSAAKLSSHDGSARKPSRLDRNFREFVPGKEVRGCRVDLDNRGVHPRQVPYAPRGVRHLREWVGRLYVGEGQGMRALSVTLDEAIAEFAGARDVAGLRQRARRFLREATALGSLLPDATTLQAALCGHANAPDPDQIAAMLSELVDRHFPKGEFHDVRVRRSGIIPIVPEKGLRVRIAAGLVITVYACEVINGGGEWMLRNPERRFVPQSWSSLGDASAGAKPKMPRLLRMWDELAAFQQA